MNKRPGIATFAVAALIVGVLALAASPALAHKKTYETSVTAAAQNKNQVDGMVISSKAKCLPSRIVEIRSAAGVLEASVVSDAQGAFRIASKDLPAGSHSVLVKKRALTSTRRHKHRCGSAETSFTVS